MSSRSTIVSVIAAAVVAFVAGHSLSQPEPIKPATPPAEAPKPAVPSVEDISKRLEEQSATAEEHKLLEALVGTFKAESRMFADPDPAAPPLTSHGTSKAEWILGKRFVKVETSVGKDAAKKEIATDSLTIYGFDTRTRKYTVLGLDTQGTYSVSAEGDYDKDSKELRLLGSVTEGGQKIKFKWNIKLADKGHTTTVLINVDADTWLKVAELVEEKQ